MAKSLAKTSKISKKMPQRTTQSNTGASKLKGVIPRPTQLEPRQTSAYFTRTCGCGFCLMTWTPSLTRYPLSLLEFYWHIYWKLGLKETETVERRRGLWTPKFYTQEAGWENHRAASKDYFSWKRKDDSGWSHWCIELMIENHSGPRVGIRALNVFPAGLQNFYEAVTCVMSPASQPPPFQIGVSWWLVWCLIPIAYQANGGDNMSL